MDTNHGFAKVAVENSEVAKRRTHLQQCQSRLQQWAQSAGKREVQGSLRHERLRKEYKRRADEQCNTEFRKQECYCKEQRDVLRALEELDAKERTMYELDVRPVQSKLAA